MRLISSDMPCTSSMVNPIMISDFAGHCGSPPALPDCSLISTERIKNGPPVIIMTMHSGIRKNAWPITSMLLRNCFGSRLLTISIRICSLSSSVQDEHSRNTMLNSTHCSSSQELEEVSKVFRTAALRADTTTATRISHARRLPSHLVNASIPRLIFRSDCNDSPSQLRLCRLDCTDLAQRLFQPSKHEASAPFQRAEPPSIGSLLITKGNIRPADYLGAAASAAGNAHVPADARAVVPAIDDEVVALRLQADGAVDRSSEHIVVGGGAERLAQIGGILVAETGVQRAGAGDPHPVAGLAEIMGHRRDEAELAAGLADAHVACGAAGVLVEVGQGVLLGKARAEQGQRDVLVDASFADVAHRHDLDQRQRHALAVRPLHQRRNFFLVQILQRNRVDLDRETRRSRRLDAGQNLVEIAPTGDGAEFGGVERIQRDVDALYPTVP